MNSISQYINEAFREVQSQRVIDLDKIGKNKPVNIPACPPMYAYLVPLSDYYDGPTEYYADDDTLDVFENYFTKNPNYRFVVNEDVISDGVDFYVKTDNDKYNFKVLLTSNEVRMNDWACIIPYKEDGQVKLLQNKKIDYLVWKEPNRNDFYLFDRENLLTYLSTAELNDNLLRIQKVKGKKDTNVFRISKSALNRMVHSAGTDTVMKLSLRNKEVFVGSDLKAHLEELKNSLLKK